MLSYTQKPKDLLGFLTCHCLHLIVLAYVFVLEIDPGDLQQLRLLV